LTNFCAIGMEVHLNAGLLLPKLCVKFVSSETLLNQFNLQLGGGGCYLNCTIFPWHPFDSWKIISLF